MGDVYLGNGHGEYEEILETLEKTPYTEDQVLEADAFQAQMFCENGFNFNSLAILALMEKGDQEKSTWEWFKTRPNHNGRYEKYISLLENCD